jgi:hypothetical protein
VSVGEGDADLIAGVSDRDADLVLERDRLKLPDIDPKNVADGPEYVVDRVMKREKVTDAVPLPSTVQDGDADCISVFDGLSDTDSFESDIRNVGLVWL